MPHRYWFGSLAIALALLAVGLQELSGWPRLILVCIAAVSAVVGLFWDRPTQSEQTTDPPPPSRLVARMADLHDASQRLSVSAEDLSLLAFLLLYPTQNRMRVKEKLDLRGSVIVKQSSTEISLAKEWGDIGLGAGQGGPNAQLFVPVMRPLKRRLITSFRVTDSSSANLSTLSHDETLVLMTKLGRVLFRDAFALPDVESEWADEAWQAYLLLLEFLLQVPQEPLRGFSARKAARQAALSGFKEATESFSVSSSESLARLEAYVELVATNYVIVALHPLAERFTINYEYRLKKEPTHPDGEVPLRKRIVGWLRRLSRSDAVNLEIAMNKSRSCSSYHLDVDLPEDSYLAQGVLTDENGIRLNKGPRSNYNLGGAYFRIAGQGQSHAHFYARQLEKLPVSPLLKVQIYERPAGSLGRAMVVAMFSLALAYYLGSAYKDPGDLNADVVAACLVYIPTMVGTYRFVRGAATRETRVVAALSSVSMLISWSVLTAAILFALLGLQGQVKAPFLGIGFFELTNWPWSVVSFAGLANCLLVAGSLANRRMQFYRIRSRDRVILDLDGVRADA